MRMLAWLLDSTHMSPHSAPRWQCLVSPCGLAQPVVDWSRACVCRPARQPATRPWGCTRSRKARMASVTSRWACQPPSGCPDQLAWAHDGPWQHGSEHACMCSRVDRMGSDNWPLTTVASSDTHHNIALLHLCGPLIRSQSVISQHSIWRDISRTHTAWSWQLLVPVPDATL